MNDEPYTKSDTDGEEPYGVDDAALILIVEVHVMIAHGRGW